MKLTARIAKPDDEIEKLFATTFTASEGVEEGALIGGLVRNLLADTPIEDIRVFCAEIDCRIVGTAIFTRLTYPEDPRIVFLLSPMAVARDCQHRGIGQALLRHSLAALRAEGVQVAMTYGDPKFYERVGFRVVTEDQARAPLPLSQPHGWIGQSLAADEMPALQGPSFCVSALNRSDIW